MIESLSSLRFGFVRPATALAVGAAAVLAGCASPSQRAPVEERKPTVVRTPTTGVPGTAQATPAVTPAPAPSADPGKPPPPGIENAGKPGYYSVKAGDTLIRVALDNGQNWRDVARWNAIENPNLIEVGQVLRVVPPGSDPNGVTVRPVAPAGRVDTRPLDGSKPAVTTTAPGAADRQKRELTIRNNNAQDESHERKFNKHFRPPPSLVRG